MNQQAVQDHASSAFLRLYVLWLSRVRVLGGAALVGVGAMVLVGWATGNRTLMSLSPDWVTMKANTALGLLVSGVALLLLGAESRAATETRRLLALFVVLLGAATLLQYVAGIHLGIDELLFNDMAAVRTSQPGRMAPASALCFMLLGGFVLAREAEAPRLGLGLALALLMLSVLAVLGYVYETSRLYQMAATTAMAMHTALAFFVAALACLSASENMRAILLGAGVHGTMFRRLAPASLFYPLVVGSLLLHAAHHDSFDIEFAMALFTMFTIVGFGGLVWFTSTRLLKLETARQRTEAERHQARLELETAVRHKDEFLAMLGHELRNPLAAVRMALDLREAAPGDERIIERTERIVDRQTRHLARLVDDLLEVSRLERDKVRLERVPMDLAQLVSDVVEDHAGRASAKNVQLESRVPPTAPVSGDRTRLAQVIGNLVGNALQHTPEGGTVTVRVSGGASTELVVEDTGPGIPEELLGHLFEPFYQGAQSIDRPQGGLGLGLAIARGMVQLHDGHIEGTNLPEGGARFVVTLAGTDEAPEARQEQPTDNAPARVRRRIVVIEDNADIADSLADLLDMEGFVVEVAVTGEAGVALVLANPPDLVLSDIGLPGFDGFEVARQIRDALGPGLRLVAITGFGQPGSQERARAAGFDDVLLKPVSLDTLRGIVNR